jgi:hypothetical protein
MHRSSLGSRGPGNNFAFSEYNFHILISPLFLNFTLFSENDTTLTGEKWRIHQDGVEDQMWLPLDIDAVLNIEEVDNKDFECSLVDPEDENPSSDYGSIDTNVEAFTTCIKLCF